MKNLASQDSITSGIELLRSALDKSWERFPLNQNLVGVLNLAYRAHREILALGGDKLEKIADADDRHNQDRRIDTSTAIPLFINDINPLAKDTYRHQVECALRVLITYHRLCEFQIKLGEYRTLKSLDSLL